MIETKTETVTGTGTPTRTVIVGQGYVGLPLAMRAVDAGHDVVGFDIDTARVARLAAGQTFIEDVTDAEVTAALATGRYLPTSDAERLAGFHTLVITVPTPLAEGIPDLSFIEAPSPPTCAPVPPSYSNRRPIPAPPRSCSAPSSAP